MDFSEKQRLELGSLSSEFNILVLISTFTAALVIAFLSLAQSLIGNVRSSRPYQFGLFFSFVAMGFHLFATLVASRAGMICFRLSKSLDTHLSIDQDSSDSQTIEEHRNVGEDGLNRLKPDTRSWYDRKLDMTDFQRFLVLCEQLQLIGTTIYIPSALFLLFFMFERKEFPIVIYAMTGLGGLAVYRLGFWKVSVLWRDLHLMYSRAKAALLAGIGKSK